MANRLTSIRLPGVWGASLADHGRKTVPEMLVAIREYAAENKRVAEAILAATDLEFRVETYVGVHRQRELEVMQSGRPATPISLDTARTEEG